MLEIGKKPDDVYPSVLDTMTEEQKELLGKMKENIEALPEYKENAKLRAWLTDLMYYRFLSGLDFDLEKATNQLTKTCKWRLEFKPEEITLKSMDFLKEADPVFVPYGYDKEGHPVMYMYIANSDSVKDDNDGAKKMALICYILEYMYNNNVFPVGRYRFTYVVDATKIGLFWAGTLKRLGGVFKDFGDHYCECLYKAHVVNAGWTLRGIYAIATAFMDPITKKKFSMSGSCSQLKDYIADEYLLEAFGGKAKYPGFDYEDLVKREELMLDGALEEEEEGENENE